MSGDGTAGPALIGAARRCLRRGYVAADARGAPYRYRKAGVVLSEIRPAGQEQRALFGPEASVMEADRARRSALMEAVDAANGRFGRRAVAFGSMGSPATLRRTRDGPTGRRGGRCVGSG